MKKKHSELRRMQHSVARVGVRRIRRRAHLSQPKVSLVARHNSQHETLEKIAVMTFPTNQFLTRCRTFPECWHSRSDDTVAEVVLILQELRFAQIRPNVMPFYADFNGAHAYLCSEVIEHKGRARIETILSLYPGSTIHLTVLLVEIPWPNSISARSDTSPRTGVGPSNGAVDSLRHGCVLPVFTHTLTLLVHTGNLHTARTMLLGL